MNEELTKFEKLMFRVTEVVLSLRLPWMKPIGYQTPFGVMKIAHAEYKGNHMWRVRVVDQMGTEGTLTVPIPEYTRNASDGVATIMFCISVSVFVITSIVLVYSGQL